MTRKADIYTQVSAMVGGETVIWANQNAPRPNAPYWTLRLSSRRQVGSEEWSQGVIGGEMTTDGIREETLEVQRIGAGSFEAVTAFRDDLMKTGVRYAWRAAGLVVFNHGEVLDVPFLLDNDSYEVRATVDLFLRLRARVTEAMDPIETIDTDGNLTDTGTGTDLACDVIAVYTGP